MPRSDVPVAVVLGAGRGRRMGGPKALVVVEEQPLWLIQKRRIEDAGVPSVWALSPEVSAIVRAHPEAPERMVESDPDAPMFSSLLAALKALPASPARGVFVLPVDCPAPSPSVWRTLAEHGPVACPTRAGVDGHPLYLDWAWVAQHVLSNGLAPYQMRLDALSRPVRRTVEVDDPAVGLNLNTPAALRRWLAGPGPSQSPRMMPENRETVGE